MTWPKPAACRKTSRRAGSIGLYVSPSWNSCSPWLARLSAPSTPPGRRTRYVSQRILNCSCAVDTWWSIVKQPTESNDSPRKGTSVESADPDRHVGAAEFVHEAGGGVGV